MIRTELRAVEFEQSKYELWDPRYSVCDREYFRIVNRIGTGASRTMIAEPLRKSRTPMELRRLFAVGASLPRGECSGGRAVVCTWEYLRRLKSALSGKAAGTPKNLAAMRPSR